MITKANNANGLWWRLLATLSVLVFLFVANTNATAQNKKAANDKVLEKAEVMPEYPGGDQAMMQFVADNVKYPQEAIDKEISGRVMVGFVVEKDGSITGISITQSLSVECDREAMRVLRMMPNWKPGIQNDLPCRTKVCIPIVFKL